MGFDGDGTRFLLATQRLGVSFERTVTIGRQGMHLDAGRLEAAYESFGLPINRVQIAEQLTTGYAETFLHGLGAGAVDSIDASSFEGATFIHDMNEPVPSERDGVYSAVIDGGSLEHIFNVPTALANCMRLVRVGGHVLFIHPANNFLGHGFYQFSPELYYRLLTPEAGFEVVRVLFKEHGLGAHWYEVADPAALGRRVTLNRGRPGLLYVLAKRISDATLGAWPQQSDYSAQWAGGHTHIDEPSATRRIAARVAPRCAKDAYRTLSHRGRRRDKAFKRVDLTSLA